MRLWEGGLEIASEPMSAKWRYGNESSGQLIEFVWGLEAEEGRERSCLYMQGSIVVVSIFEAIIGSSARVPSKGKALFKVHV